MTIFEASAMLIIVLLVLWFPYLVFLFSLVHCWITTEYTIIDDLGIAVIAVAVGVLISELTWFLAGVLIDAIKNR